MDKKSQILKELDDMALEDWEDPLEIIEDHKENVKNYERHILGIAEERKRLDRREAELMNGLARANRMYKKVLELANELLKHS